MIMGLFNVDINRVVRDPIGLDIVELAERIDKALEEFNEVDWEKIIREEKFVYFFGDPSVTEGNAGMKELLGGKGANLAEMSNLGIPVPYGFTITTLTTSLYFKIKPIKQLLEEIIQLPSSMKEELGERLTKLNQAMSIIRLYEDKLYSEINQYLKKLETLMGRKLGDPKDPLLVSVRSGASVSMPGMMDTVLNLGLNDESVIGLAKTTGDYRFAYDSYRRFILMYAKVVLKADYVRLEEIQDRLLIEKGYTDESQFTVEELKDLIKRFKQSLMRQGKRLPQDPIKQLYATINAVYESSMSERAMQYRREEHIPLQKSLSAVNIQAMVFGNKGNNSGSAVVATHNLNTGEKILNGDFLLNAQGEEVVAGKRITRSIKDLRDDPQLSIKFPGIYNQIEAIADKLFAHYKDAQDIELTIEEGKLWILQTRSAKRHPRAAIVIAVDLVHRGWITKEEAVIRFGDPNRLDVLLNPEFDSEVKQQARNEGRVITKGINASPGAAVGRIVFSSEEAIKWAEDGEKVILVREETSPEDLGGILVSQGILTSLGGRVSHAALVARQFGKPAVVGAQDIEINFRKKQFTINGKVYKQGDFISLDGFTGEIFEGRLPLVDSIILRAQRGEELTEKEQLFYEKYLEFMSWIEEIWRGAKLFSIMDKICRRIRSNVSNRGNIKVYANAERPADIKLAIENGAQGLGLVRTEHMFFEHVELFQEMILAETEEARKDALDKLLPYQQKNFEEILRLVEGRPVRIRLLDPPLHEFLPKLHEKDKITLLAMELGVSEQKIRERIIELREENPMFGFRGARLLIVYPEIVKMQVRAIFQAAEKVKSEGIPVNIEVMIPLINEVAEYKIIRDIITQVANEFGFKYNDIIKDFLIGTMIELVGATLNAQDIAREADFFSFGTNDLTQGIFKFSRDDVNKQVIPVYLREGILEVDPFVSLDLAVIEFIAITIAAARAVNPDIKIGICGEQAFDPYTIQNYLIPLGLVDSISGSSRRIPIALLAVAQAIIGPEEEVTNPVTGTFEDYEIEELKKISVIETEDSFLADDKIQASRKLILKGEKEELLPLQINYYQEIIKKTRGESVTIKLLNVPLQDFFEGKKKEEFSELNPGLGNRGPRLAITTHPQLYQTQLEAIFKAQVEQIKKGESLKLRILIPFIIKAEEVVIIKNMIKEVAANIAKEEGIKIEYQVGASIETPSAALDAYKIAQIADFLVIDTHGLTEATLGIFEADAKDSFLPIYLEKEIFLTNPFEIIQANTVGRLINVAVNRAKNAKKNIEIFITNP